MPSSKIRLIERASGNKFPAAPEGTVLFSSANVGWSGITVELHRIPPLELPEHYVEGHRLLVQMGKPARFEWHDSSRWRQVVLKPGDFCLQTHGELNTPRWQDNLEFLAIALDPAFVNQIFQDTKLPDAVGFQQRRGEFDPAIAHFALHFKAELESSHYSGVLYGESMGLAFALHLLEQHGERSFKLPRVRSQFSSMQLRQIIEYVHEHLSQELSLTALAEQVNLSAYHFARIFKNSLRLSPHQYVLRNRVERAKQLIANSATTRLTDIGLQVGFYDQAHFAKSFKQVVGCSPKTFSRLVRN